MIFKFPFKTFLALYKKWKRYLRKLLTAKNPLLKAFNICCIATSLSATADAQCNIFSESDVNNPIQKITQAKSLSNTCFIDIDNDGDLDCYETYVDAQSQLHFVLLRNIGTPKLPQYKIDTADGFPKTGVGTSTRWNGGLPRFADIDGDGDYDCFISLYDTNSFGYSRIYFWENIGTKTKPNFVKNDVENPLAIAGHYFMDFNLADVDGDGDYDMVFRDLYYSRFFENVGTKTNPLFVEQKGSNNPFFPLGLSGYESFYDWDKDGLPDYGFSQTGSYLRNVGTVGNAKYIEDSNGPTTTLGSAGQWLDINNDGFPEIFALYGPMETTAPHAEITAQNINDSTIKLKAVPQGNYLYRWRKKGVIIQGATKSTLTVKQNGYYTVEIKDSCGVGTSLPYKVLTLLNRLSDDGSNAIATNDKINVQAFPNPFTSEFVIQLNSSTNQNSVIKIADANGKIVSEFTLTSNIIQLGKQLQRGVYFVQVLQNNIVMYKQKVVKR